MERSIKGKVSELEGIIHSIISKFDVVSIENSNNCKPSMYNVWIISDISTTKNQATDVFTKLSAGNFCKNSEVDRMADELTRTSKIRLAVLPKNCIDSVIHDLKQIIDNCNFEFVLNECVE